MKQAVLAVLIFLSFSVPLMAQSKKPAPAPEPVPASSTVKPVVSATIQLAIVQAQNDQAKLAQDAQAVQTIFNDLQARNAAANTKIQELATQAVVEAGLNPDDYQLNLSTMNFDQVKKPEPPKPAAETGKPQPTPAATPKP